MEKMGEKEVVRETQDESEAVEETRRESPQNEHLVQQENILENLESFPISQLTQATDAEKFKQKLNKHTDAEEFIKNATREIVQIKVMEDFNYRVTQNMTEKIEAKIKDTNKKLSSISLESDAYKKLLLIDKQDVLKLSTRVKATGEVVASLKDFVNSLKTNQSKINYAEQMEKFLKLNGRIKHLQQLWDQLNKRTKLLVEHRYKKNSENNKDFDIKKKKLEYKKTEVENTINVLTKKLNTLKKDNVDKTKLLEDANKENKTLLKKRENLLSEITTKKTMLDNAQQLYALKKVEFKSQIEILNKDIDYFNVRHEELKQKVGDIVKNRNSLKYDYKQQLKIWECLQSEIKELDEQINFKMEIVKENKVKLVEIDSLYKDKLIDFATILKDLEERYQSLKKDRKKLQIDLNSAKSDCFMKLQQKISLTIAESELKGCVLELQKSFAVAELRNKSCNEKFLEKDKELKTAEAIIDDINLKNKQFLETHNVEIEKIQNEIQITDVNHQEKVEALSKDQEYAAVSQNYLKEKIKSLQEKIELTKLDNHQVQETIIKIKTSIEHKHGKFNQLNNYLNKLKSSKSDLQGILKSPGRPLAGPSPKKVKFEGIPSSESSQDIPSKPNIFNDWIKQINNTQDFRAPK